MLRFPPSSCGTWQPYTWQIPHVRLIILVRDPVKRAWSEYQMKVRRVQEQEEAFEMLNKDANKVYSCVVKQFPSEVDSISPR